MKLCPICQRCYEDTETSCLIDQSDLVISRLGTRTIAGKYRLDRLLGRGGMGAVYAGTHVDLDRPCAIKLLLSDFTSDADALERFRREARAAARLNHPNVADTYDYGVLTSGGAYIVMELVEGQTLREYMDATGPMPIPEAAEIARQVADGVAAAHRSGTVHRDLKPSNIILARDHEQRLQAKVVDFGVAKLKEYSTTGSGLTSSGSLLGTPRYMSPEQCSGHTTDASSDIYSLGVILFEMIAGQPPFDAPTATAIAIKHIQQPPPSLREFRPDASVELDDFLRQVLDKDPAKRPQSAAEFASTLRSLTVEHGDPRRESNEPPKLAESPQASRSAIGRETHAFTPANIATDRAGGPTLESAWSSEEQRDPSVLGYASTDEGVTEASSTGFDAPFVPDTTAEAAPDLSVKERSLPALETETIVPPQSPKPSSRRHVVMYGIIAMAFAVAVAWFALRGPSEQMTAENGPSPGGVATSQPSGAAPTLTEPRSPDRSTRDNSLETMNPASTESAPRDRRAELKAALQDWIAATNARDLEKHMSFYAPTLTVFYRKHNATQAAVRAEKAGLLSRASSIDVRASEPEIEIDADGKTAAMRFHKTWSFNGTKSEEGEVVQELRWQKTDSGWKIVSERDVQVIRVPR